MELSSKFFEDEVRSGFYVPSLMKKYWAVQMKVLSVIDDICVRHGIKWFVDCGTLLGAVRHNGVVPWDDDFDIAMKREDFEKFTRIAMEEVKEPYFLMSHKINGYWEEMTRIVNSTCINFEHEYMNEFYGCPYPAGIDIFPLDCVPPEEDAQLVRDILEIIYKLINETAPMFEEADDGPLNGNTRVSAEFLADMDRKCTLLEELTRQKIDRNEPLRRQLFDILSKVHALYTEDESTHVAILSIWMDNERNKAPLKYYDGNVVEIPFEEGTIKVPAAYDAILRSKYGDYMKPIRQWDFHGYPLYDEHYQTMVDAGVGPRRYAYDAKALANTERTLTRNARQRAEGFLKLLPGIVEDVVAKAENGNAALACELLTKLQEGAIEVGNLLEEAEGADFCVIPILEAYCEHIFSLFNCLCENGSMEAVRDEADQLNQLSERALSSLRVNSSNHREVVFLVSRIEAWPYMENVWKKERETEGTDVYVVPIQFIYKDFIGAAKEICYEMNQLPSYVEVTEVDAYDFVKRHPDVIYTHDHFEGENDTVTIHPALYSSNLKKFCESIVYIPSFIVDEYNAQDSRACRVMQDYVCMPGIVHADQVYVRSEQTRTGYIDTLVQWAGEETRSIWEEKIVVCTLPFDDVEKRKIYEIPKAWESYIRKADGAKRKVVLFSNGTSTLIEHGNAMLDKIERVLDTFKASSEDVALVWRPHPGLRDALIGEYPEVWNRFSEIIRRYREENWGILDLGENLDTVIGISDAYYGDTGSIPQRFRDVGKPVMLLAVDV